MREPEPCPICGRKPKVMIYQINAGYAYCRGAFFHRHKVVKGNFVKYARPTVLMDAIYAAWNRRVTDA